MTAPARTGLSVYVVGVVLFFIGLYGVARELSPYVSVLGISVLLLGIVLLVRAAWGMGRTWPNPVAVLAALLGIAFHLYIDPFRRTGTLSLGMLIWSSTPYVLCVVVSCFAATRAPVIAGAAIALLFDLYTHYGVTTSKGSTAALAYLFAPLWNLLVFSPFATFVAWWLRSRRRGHVHNAR